MTLQELMMKGNPDDSARTDDEIDYVSTTNTCVHHVHIIL